MVVPKKNMKIYIQYWTENHELQQAIQKQNCAKTRKKKYLITFGISSFLQT